MDELDGALHFRILRQLGLQPVFDRLDVVVGFGLDRLCLSSVLLGERGDDPLELGGRVLRERLDLGERRFGGECEEPADLDCDAVAEERGFAESGPQRLELLVIASVQRG